MATAFQQGQTTAILDNGEQGYEIEAIRRRIARRASTSSAASPPHIGALRGFVDTVCDSRIEGWAQSLENPDAPVCLDIYADGRLIGQTLANLYREDLAQAGLGSGRHGFFLAMPEGLAFAAHAIDVRRALDGTSLEFSAGAIRTPSLRSMASAQGPRR